MTRFDSIDRAIADIAAGKAVVVIDDEDRENEGDLIFAAEKANPELVAFMVRYSSGYICVSLSEDACDRLELPPMVQRNQDRRGTAYTITVDLAASAGTGISAADRAATIRALADPQSRPEHFNRPGHVVPLRARRGGVLVRAGHTEAAGDLARLAGLSSVGVLCEVVSEREPTAMAKADELREFADTHDLALVSIADLIAWRRRNEQIVKKVAESELPTEFGNFRAHAYHSLVDEVDHLALVIGDVSAPTADGILVRVHSECLTGDVFSSLRCDCGPQLRASLELVAQAGQGIVLYMRGHEGRGVGLAAKIQAYALQDEGADTVDANLALGLPADAREYGTGAQILRDLGVTSMRLLTNNPTKRAGLDGYGLSISQRVPVPVRVTPENLRYLKTKRDRMGHALDGLDTALDEPAGQTSAWIQHPSGPGGADLAAGYERTANS